MAVKQIFQYIGFFLVQFTTQPDEASMFTQDQ